MRDESEKMYRNLGLVKLSEANRRQKDYISNREAKRMETARNSSLEHLASAIGRNDAEKVQKYAKTYFKLYGEPAKLESFLTKTAEKMGMTPQQYMQTHANSLAKIVDVKRRLEMEWKKPGGITLPGFFVICRSYQIGSS